MDKPNDQDRPQQVTAVEAPPPDQAKPFMDAALALSKREGMATFWFVQDQLNSHDYPGALAYIDRMLRGEPSDLTLHPRRPDADARRIVRYEFACWPDKKGRVVVPRHREQTIGVARSIARTAGWS